MNCIFYYLMTAHIECNETRHAQDVMEELGITYKKAVPQSMFDQWQFFGCENVPDELPPYMKIKEVDPMDYVGNGLSLESAKKLSAIDKKGKL